jgi:hypothetical protein
MAVGFGKAIVRMRWLAGAILPLGPGDLHPLPTPPP